MDNKILLPPLPEPVGHQVLILAERWTHCTKTIHDAAAKRDPSTARILHSAKQLRARDLEVARCVLAAAAKAAGLRESNRFDAFTLDCTVERIRALEFGHD